MHALWLEDPDQDNLVIVDMPRETSELSLNRIYDGPTFLAAISRLPIVGLKPREGLVPRARTAIPESERAIRPGVGRTIHDIRYFFIIFLLGNVIWILVLAISTLFTSDGGVASFLGLLGRCGLLSGAALILGTVLGFIFGIPRSLASASAAIAQKMAPGDGSPRQLVSVRPNTNLEQISDWLTKILVGVGLTQITKVPPYLQALSQSLDGAFAPIQQGGIIGISILGAFGLGGFIWAYFESRTSLMQVFNEDDGADSMVTPQIGQAPIKPPTAPPAPPTQPPAPATQN